MLTPGDGSILVEWEPPPDDGGSSITGYRIYIQQLARNGCSLGGKTGIDVAVRTSYTIRNLTNGCTYRVTVAARNAVGLGPDSQFGADATPTGDYPPPTGLTATPSETSILVSWTPPADATPADYRIRWAEGNGSFVDPIATNTPEHTITGLEPGTRYRIEVQARYGDARQHESSWAFRAAETVDPDYPPPTGLTATPSETSILVSWTPPADATPLRYEVQWAPGEGTWLPARRTNFTSFDITNLASATRYRIQVRAVYDSGASAWVDLESSTLEVGALAVPEGLAVTPTQTSILVSWTAPTADGPPDDYQVRWAEGEGRWSAPRDTNFTSFDITDLTPGTRYRVQVRARYPSGESGWVDASISTLPPTENMPPTVDQLPQSLTIGVGGSADVDVAATFVDPENDTLTYAGRSSRPDVVSVTQIQSGSRFTLRALKVGQASITITANDGQPGRVPVPASFGVTVDERPNSAPEPVGPGPGLVRVEVGQTEVVSLLFSDPDGDDLTYRVASARPGIASVKGATTPNGVDVSVTGVAAGTAAVTAVASDGRLTTTTTFTVEVAAAFGPPTGLQADADETHIVISWTQGVPRPDRYRVRYREIIQDMSDGRGGTGGNWVDAGTTTSTRFTLRNLRRETTYEFEVRSETSVSPATDECAGQCSAWVGVQATTGSMNQAPVADPTAIPSPLVVPKGSSRLVDVGPAFSDPDIDDVLKFAAVSAEPRVAAVSVDGSRVTFRGVAVGEVPTTVTATDPGGLSASIPVPVSVVLSAVPPAPAGVAARLTPGRVLQVSWTRFDDFWEVDRYAVEYALRGAEPVVVELPADSAPPWTSMALDEGVYSVRVRAGNAAGMGPWSPPVSAVVTPDPVVAFDTVIPLFDPGGMIEGDLLVTNPSVFALEVELTVTRGFVVGPPGGDRGRSAIISIPAGDRTAAFEVAEAVPYTDVGTNIDGTLVISPDIRPTESGATVHPTKGRIIFRRSNKLPPPSEVFFDGYPDGRLHAPSGRWVEGVIAIDPPIPPGGSSRGTASFLVLGSPFYDPLTDTLSPMPDFRIDARRPFPADHRIVLQPGQSSFTFEVRLTEVEPGKRVETRVVIQDPENVVLRDELAVLVLDTAARVVSVLGSWFGVLLMAAVLAALVFRHRGALGAAS